jgi:hypothetical protein
MQAIARWGNYFNQELYGPPTTLPWGIPIDCAHRIAAYPCSTFPFETTRFHPLFLYESISGILGCLALIWIGYHWRKRLRPGDLLLLFFVWYGIVRFVLEGLRHDNWTFYGVPVAQLVSLGFVIPAILLLLYRHRPRHGTDAPPSRPAVATWGAPGTAAIADWRTRPVDEPWANVGPPLAADDEAKGDAESDIDTDDDGDASPSDPAVPDTDDDTTKAPDATRPAPEPPDVSDPRAG